MGRRGGEERDRGEEREMLQTIGVWLYGQHRHLLKVGRWHWHLPSKVGSDLT